MEVGATGGQMGLEVMKKSMEAQEQAVLKALDSAQVQTQQVSQEQQTNTAALTGIGGNLNIKA